MKRKKKTEIIVSPVFLQIRGREISQIVEEVCQRRMLTIPQAANYLSCKPHSIRALIRAGKIPIIQRGSRGKIWVDIRDLERLIQSEKRYIA